MITDEVPTAFREGGYSGLFRREATTDAAATTKYLEQAPCLLGNTGYMVLGVEPRDDGTGVATVVRRDDAAVTDVFGITR